MRRLLSLLTLTCLLASGCAGESGTISTASDAVSSSEAPAPDAETGSVAGLVVNEEFQPVAGAQVGLLDGPSPMEGKTDAAGKFVLNQVQPGSYRLVVNQLGYESVARKLDALAGQTVEVQVTLVAIAIATSTHKTELVGGMIGCSTTVYTAQSAQRQVGVQCGEGALGTNAYPNQKNLHAWTVPSGWQTHIADLDWRANSEMAKELRLMLSTIIDCTPVVCLVATAYNDERTGPRPVQVRLEYEDEKDLGKTFEMKARTRSGISGGATPSASLVIDQRYTIYVTNFFGEQAPEGFSAAPPEPV